jgi:pyruvate dehydrogenase E1 component alpha subunit
VTDTVAVTPELQRFLDPEGRAVRPLPAFAEEPGALISLYRAMALTRTFDAKAIALQRTGRLGTYASSLGQEAVAVGIGAAMTPEDVLLPSFRELGAQILRGITLDELLLFWGGDERGSNFKGPREDFPICVPVGSHGPHAAGVALAFKLRRQLGLRAGRRRHLQGGCLRGHEPGRRVAPAPGLRGQQQSVGHLGPAGTPDRGQNPRPEG